VTVDVELVVGQREAITDSLLAESWITGAPAEEVLAGNAQLDNRHLGRVLGHFQHPRKLVAFDGVELTA